MKQKTENKFRTTSLCINKDSSKCNVYASVSSSNKCYACNVCKSYKEKQ